MYNVNIFQSFRYFFKKACDEFDSGVVHEEYFDDNDILPLWDGKIFGKIERKQQWPKIRINDFPPFQSV